MLDGNSSASPPSLKPLRLSFPLSELADPSFIFPGDPFAFSRGWNRLNQLLVCSMPYLLCACGCVCVCVCLSLSLAFFTSLPISTPCFWQKKSPVRSSGMILDTPPFSSSTTSSFNSTSKTLVVVKLIRSYLSYHSPFPHGSRSSKPHSHILSHLRFRI